MYGCCVLIWCVIVNSCLCSRHSNLFSFYSFFLPYFRFLFSSGCICFVQFCFIFLSFLFFHLFGESFSLRDYSLFYDWGGFNLAVYLLWKFKSDFWGLRASNTFTPKSFKLLSKVSLFWPLFIHVTSRFTFPSSPYLVGRMGMKSKHNTPSDAQRKSYKAKRKCPYFCKTSLALAWKAPLAFMATAARWSTHLKSDNLNYKALHFA